jgi:peptidoglycan/xylan/chitin deacetylase (PgdA/CDA1 family)
MRADPGLYRWLPWEDRPRIRWPNGARVALWIAPNIEFYEYHPPANPKRKPWPRPFPDVLGYSTRDYGNRVGHQRMMAVLDRYGLRGSVSLSTALCVHHPEVIAMAAERGWEFFSHGIYNTRYVYGMDEDQERAMLAESMALIERHTGQHCDGYLAPALSHTERTIDLFAELGGRYTCDLFHDDQPTPIRTRSGRRFVSVPYSLELNDTIVYVVNRIEPRRYGQMIRDAFDRLYAEGADSGTVMCIPLHAYQVSHPHRLDALDRALEYICRHDGVWKATGREIAAHFLAHHYDDFLAAEERAGAPA